MRIYHLVWIAAALCLATAVVNTPDSLQIEDNIVTYPASSGSSSSGSGSTGSGSGSSGSGKGNSGSSAGTGGPRGSSSGGSGGLRGSSGDRSGDSVSGPGLSEDAEDGDGGDASGGGNPAASQVVASSAAAGGSSDWMPKNIDPKLLSGAGSVVPRLATVVAGMTIAHLLL